MSPPKRGPAARSHSSLVENGDEITIDGDEKKLQLHVDDAELEKRRAKWSKPEIREKRGVLNKYAMTVRSASEGAVTS